MCEFFLGCSGQCCVSRMASWLFHLHRVRNGSSSLFKPPVTHCIFSPMFVTAWAVFRTHGRIMALLRSTTICGSQAVWNVYVAWIFKSVDNHNKAQSPFTSTRSNDYIVEMLEAEKRAIPHSFLCCTFWQS